MYQPFGSGGGSEGGRCRLRISVQPGAPAVHSNAISRRCFSGPHELRELHPLCSRRQPFCFDFQRQKGIEGLASACKGQGVLSKCLPVLREAPTPCAMSVARLAFIASTPRALHKGCQPIIDGGGGFSSEGGGGVNRAPKILGGGLGKGLN